MKLFKATVASLRPVDTYVNTFSFVMLYYKLSLLITLNLFFLRLSRMQIEWNILKLEE